MKFNCLEYSVWVLPGVQVCSGWVKRVFPPDQVNPLFFAKFLASSELLSDVEERRYEFLGE